MYVNKFVLFNVHVHCIHVCGQLTLPNGLPKQLLPQKRTLTKA